MVYRAGRVSRAPSAAAAVREVCRKRYAALATPICARDALAQQLGRDAVRAALELAAAQQTIGAESVRAMSPPPPPRTERAPVDHDRLPRLRDMPPQRAVARDLAQYAH